MRPVPREALQLIKTFEGFSAGVYICPAGVPTIGFGHALKEGEMSPDARITRSKADTLLRKDVAWASRAVRHLINVKLTDGQYGALVSFTFNLGSGRLQSSTLRMKLNRGDYDGAASEFWKWRRAGGVILSGLVRRRAAEEALFRAPQIKSPRASPDPSSFFLRRYLRDFCVN